MVYSCFYILLCGTNFQRFLSLRHKKKYSITEKSQAWKGGQWGSSYPWGSPLTWRVQCARKPQFVLWFIKRQNFLFSTFYEKPRRGIKTSHTVCGKHQGLNSVEVRTDLRYTYANHIRDQNSRRSCLH